MPSKTRAPTTLDPRTDSKTDKQEQTRERNPKYVPPADGSCPVNERLPPELLAYIFELGTRAAELEEEAGEDGWRPWERSVLEHLEIVEAK